MYFRIWKENTIPVDEGYTLVCSGPYGKKHDDLESAKKELKELAESNFGYGKYRIKKIISIEKKSDREYLVTLDLKSEIEERFYILPNRES